MSDTLEPHHSPCVKPFIYKLGAFLILIELLTFRIPPAEALSKEKLNSRIFSKLWLRLNTTIFAGEAETALPSLVASASGTVLELGPGSGNQLSRYDISKVSKIYGVEHNIELHPALRQTIKKCGLADIYTIVPGGIEDHEVLSKNGIERHSIDTVMTVSVLCSVPQPKKVAQELHELLKHGGRMVVYEHVRSEDAISKVVQGTFLGEILSRKTASEKNIIVCVPRTSNYSSLLFRRILQHGVAFSLGKLSPQSTYGTISA